MADHSIDMLCKAVDMAENAISFYDEALSSCSTALGRESFETLKQDKEDHLRRIQDVYQGLQKGGQWEAVCKLPEDEITDGKAMFRELAAKYDEFQSCPASEADALERALDLEQRIVTFYEEQLEDAEDPTEQAFLEHLLEEARSHHLLLVDMESYFEDPVAWAREGHLDGA